MSLKLNSLRSSHMKCQHCSSRRVLNAVTVLPATAVMSRRHPAAKLLSSWCDTDYENNVVLLIISPHAARSESSCPFSSTFSFQNHMAFSKMVHFLSRSILPHTLSILKYQGLKKSPSASKISIITTYL